MGEAVDDADAGADVLVDADVDADAGVDADVGVDAGVDALRWCRMSLKLSFPIPWSPVIFP